MVNSGLKSRSRLQVLWRAVEKEANINAVDADGSRVLHQAVLTGSRSLVRFVLWKGAVVDARDRNGRSALHAACKSKHAEMKSMVVLLLSAGAKVNAQCVSGFTPLHEACCARRQDLIAVLLQGGALVDLADKHGVTPIHLIARYGIDDLPIANTLIERTADVNVLDAEGRTPLHHACYKDVITIVFAILNRGAELNLRDSMGETPLHLASIRNSKIIVTMLLCKGAGVDLKNDMGRTPLHLASMSGSIDVVDPLLDYGADVNAVDSVGLTPLDLASSLDGEIDYFPSLERPEMIEKLLRRGAKVVANSVSSDALMVNAIARSIGYHVTGDTKSNKSKLVNISK